VHKTVQTGPEQIYISGTVLNECGTIVDKESTAGCSEDAAILNNEFPQFGGSKYSIRFKKDSGMEYTFAILESNQHGLEALSLAIEPKTRIKMLEHDFRSHLNGLVGRIYDYELVVLRY